jgi:hypothetical protein
MVNAEPTVRQHEGFTMNTAQKKERVRQLGEWR